LFILNDLKFFRTVTLSLTNHLWILIAIGIFWMFGKKFCRVWWFVLSSSWPPLLWGVLTSSILIHYWWFLVSDESTGGVQVLFGHQKLWSPPLGSSLPKPFQPFRLFWLTEILGELNLHGIVLWEIVQISTTNESNGLHPCKRGAQPRVHYWLCL
jgi:hypothetical protein